MRRRAGSSNTPPPNPLAEWLARAGLGDDVRDALVTWLLKQFMSDLYAKLEQGSHQEGGVPLRRVFVDLPISLRPTSDAQDGERRLFLQTLFKQKPAPLWDATDRMDPSDDPLVLDTPRRQAGSVPALERLSRRRAKGFLIIGGPGQGKSTLGQIACQAHRAALLLPDIDRLQHNQQEAVRSFTDAGTKRDLGRSGTALFPVHVVLPEAAAWLAQRDRSTEAHAPHLLTWFTEKAASRGARLAAAALHRFLANAPLLLILDGLDEIGAAEDRALVVAALHELLASLGQAGAQGVVVAATRPQGYAGELERVGVPLSTVYLAPLRPDEALSYGRKLTEVKLRAQPNDQKRVLRGLQSAVVEPATARLMTTPLQVTILVALVQRMGKPPSERWTLLKRYFETVYDREVERGTYATPLLREHRTHIEHVHARVGLLLQVESERANAGEARMARERLEAVAHEVLAEDDVDDETRAALVGRIVRAAGERLVFLVEPEPGKFGFEIRSLQEFMAAWALSADGDALVEERLVHIAGAPTFRAVTVLLASKLVSERSPLRGRLADSICRTLDEDPADIVSRETRAGAELALEILEEGSVLSQPKFAKQLMERACFLLDLPPSPLHVSLSSVPGEHAARVLEAAAKDRLRSLPTENALGAWVAVAAAAAQDRPWARATGAASWASIDDANSLWLACDLADLPPSSYHWLVDQAQQSPEKMHPEALISWYDSTYEQFPGEGWISAFLNAHDSLTSWRRPCSYDGTDVAVTWIEVEGSGDTARSDRAAWRRLAGFTEASECWRPWVDVAQFAQRPSAAMLAATLRKLAEPSAWQQRTLLANHAPWPIAACLRSADTQDELLSFASSAASGALGDGDDWRAAEQGWASAYDFQVFLRGTSQMLPWRRDRLRSAPPPGAVNTALARRPLEHIPRTSWRVVERIRSSALRAHLSEVFLYSFSMSIARRLDRFSWDEIEPWLDATRLVPGGLISRGLRSPRSRGVWLDGLEQLGRRRTLSLVRYLWDVEVPLEDVVGAYRQHPDRHGLLYWLRESASLYDDRERVRKNDDGLKVAISEAIMDYPLTGSALDVDAALIRVWVGAVAQEELDGVIRVMENHAGGEPDTWLDLVKFAEGGALPSDMRERLLAAVFRSSSCPPEAARSAFFVLRRSLQTRRSDLANPATWSRLRLPKPLPLSDSSAHQAFSLPATPVSLSRIELKNIRGIPDLTLDLAPPAAVDQGQWTVILGPNGAGKTTLLRAVTLALRNLSDPKIWPRGTFATPWRSNRGAPGPSLISATLAGGTTFRVTVQRNGSESFVREPKDHPTPFPVFAYGCRRGSALGGASREVQLGEDDGPEIATLFDEGAPLIHAETWLKEWDGAAAREPAKYGAAYEAVRGALQKLLALDEVIVRDRQVLVTGPLVGTNVPFAALSDGYLTTAGWFLDLVARWIDLALKYKHPAALSADLLALMTGLVLLDEIDLHLHPRWQIEVIPRVKKLLPRMSFVVTTHNPLTLVGARPEEIWILCADGGEVRAERGTEAPMLLTGGQIYSRYFGIQDIYPHEIGEALRRYGFLSGDPRRTEEEQVEMEGLREKLRTHGIEPGWEEVPREVTRARGRAPRAKRTSR